MRLTILERPTASTAHEFPAHLEAEFRHLKGELSASVRIDGFSPGRWTKVEVTGEDAEIVTELISNKFGLAPSTGSDVAVPGVHRAEIVRLKETGLELDLGLGSGNGGCLIPWSHLTAQLTDGKPMRPPELVDHYCLYPPLKTSVQVTSRRSDEMEAWLSDAFTDQLARWITTGLDRIQIFDCYRDEAETAVAKSRLTRDVIGVEPISLTLQSVVCKLGTDAVGLMPKLGHVLREKGLKPFVPKRILERCRPW